MQIRDAEDQDHAGVRTVVGAAFGDPGVAALWADVEALGLARLSLVALDDAGTVVGHVGVSLGRLDARPSLVDVLVLSPLSVDPQHQRRGIGSDLLAAALDRARSSDFPLLVLEGSPDFYGARGFEPAHAHGVEPASRRTPEPACQVALLPAHEPWMSGRIVYRDVWWEHDAAGLRDPELARVERALGASGPR